MDTSTKMSREEVESLYDPGTVLEPVHKAISTACSGIYPLTRFISRYANLNAWFGSGVASLAGKLGRSRGVFVDFDEPVLDIADRSVLVGSYFFDAARDEFDDRDTPHRDTHRCLAQAFIKGLFEFHNDNYGLDTVANRNELLDPPIWLTGIGARVSTGYGVSTSNTSTELFRSMGYHLGSEILAESEFTLIDEALREKLPEVVKYLSSHKFAIAGQEHNGYAWIGLHSSLGSAKEADHFAWATQGVEVALSFVLPKNRATYRHQIHLGVGSFVRDHQEFFSAVSL